MKKTLLISAVFLFANLMIAQTTAIPDASFEQALINLGYDIGPIDGQILTANINTVTAMDISYAGISDLTGIENFIAMDSLSCHGNQLKSLDVSSLTNLFFLSCEYNLLECLNVKNGNNNNLTTFFALGNPNLTCIEVDDTAYSNNTWKPGGWSFNVGSASFSTNCACLVGISENKITQKSIYPNPTTGKISIDLGEDLTNLIAVLSNSIGQIILTQKFDSTNYINIDIDAPKGIYFLQLKISKGKNKTLKIIKE